MLSLKGFHEVERQWGKFIQFTENENTTVKLLHITEGKSISYQYHNHRAEQWYVISGRVWVIKEIKDGTLSHQLLPGQMERIEPREKHKLEALEDSVILEISKGLFDESDIVRLDSP